jgi:Cysteine-rich CWC
MLPEPQEKLCPFCESPNLCAVSAPGGCWCGSIEIPMELIDLLPEIGKSCICLLCVNAYQANSQGFIRAKHLQSS